MKKIILASQSKRRKDLLFLLIGDNFEIKESSYEEDNTLDLEPKDLVLLHSLKKGQDVATKKQGIIISADTLVVLKGKVLGKPQTKEKAKEMLNQLKGEVIEVFTGLAVIDGDKELQDYEVTRLKMKDMEDEEIDEYVESGEPLDKAGAFGIQGRGSVFIEKIEGCYFNIVGLPLFTLNKMLKEVGVNIFDY